MNQSQYAPDGICIIVPALNEEKNIQAAIASIVYAVKGIVPSYQIVVVDDGSTDQTASLAEKEALKNPNVLVIRHGTNKGYGVAFETGLKAANQEYYTIFPGDNDLSPDSLRSIIQQRGQADVITAYSVTHNRRSRARRIVSRTFVMLMNLLFGLRLKYYTGPFLTRTALLKTLTLKSQGLTVLAECLIRLIKKGHSYKVITFEHAGRKGDKTKAFSFKSIVSVLKAVAVVFVDVQLKRKANEKHQ